MPVYIGPKEKIDKVIRALRKKDREKIKRYTIIVPSGLVEVETTEEIRALKDLK